MLQCVPTCLIHFYEQDAAVIEMSNHMLDVTLTRNRNIPQSRYIWYSPNRYFFQKNDYITLRIVSYRSKSFDLEFKTSILSTLYGLCKQTMRIW